MAWWVTQQGGSMRQDARGVWDTYLKELTELWTKKQELSFIWMNQSFVICSAWFLVHLSPHGPKSVVLVLELLYLFSSLQMVSGQQILEACMKNFVIILRLAVHIQALRKNGFEDFKVWIPKMLTIIFLFLFFFAERETLLFWFFYCSPFLE